MIRNTDAGLFWGEKAISAGLADQVGSFDDALAAVTQAAKGFRQSRATASAEAQIEEGEETIMAQPIETKPADAPATQGAAPAADPHDHHDHSHAGHRHGRDPDPWDLEKDEPDKKKNGWNFDPEITITGIFQGNVSTANENPARNRWDTGLVEFALRAPVAPMADVVLIVPVVREVHEGLIFDPEEESEGVETLIEIEEAYLYLHDFGVPNLTAKLPIDASDLAVLATLAPGVVSLSGSDTTAAGFSVAGQRPTSNSTTLDGLTFGGASVPQDAIRNTRVITNSYDVARGQFSGGQVATVEGGFEGFKITTDIDLLFAEQVLEARRKGLL